ncbi:hypothetical protein BH09BAC3_BH09BAC3_01050 [soil metagenome]
MKDILLIISFSLASFQAHSQQQLAEIPMERGQIESLQAFEVGDSLFVRWKFQLGRPVERQAFWISSDGKISEHPQSAKERSNFIQVSRKGDDFYFYFITRDSNKFKLRAQIYNRITKKSEILKKSIVVEGPLVSSFKNDHVNILCLAETKKAMIAYQLDGMELIDAHEISIGWAVEPLKKGHLEFYDRMKISNANIGTSRAKLIRDDSLLYFLWDGPNITMILRISLPEYKIKRFYLQQTPNLKFTTFVLDDLLYKVSREKKVIMLDVLKLSSGEKIQTIRYDFSEAGLKNSYSREGSKHLIQKEKKFDVTVGLYDELDWSLIVERGTIDNKVRIGVYFNEKGVYTGGPLTGGIASMMFNIIVQNAIIQSMEGPGISRYLYFVESKDHTVLSDDQTGNQLCESQRADDYEIAMEEEKKKIKLKAYATFKGSLVGIYKMKDKLIFVKF